MNHVQNQFYMLSIKKKEGERKQQQREEERWKGAWSQAVSCPHQVCESTRAWFPGEQSRRQKVQAKEAGARPALRRGGAVCLALGSRLLCRSRLRCLRCAPSAESQHQLPEHCNARANASGRRPAPAPASLKGNLFLSPMKEL